MANAPPTAQYPTQELRSWNKKLEAYNAAEIERQQLQQTILRQTAELTTALQIARTDLDDQNEIRRKWRKRAEDVESRVARNQFAVVLIDGNRFVFRTEAMRSGAAGAAEICSAFLNEARTFIKGRHVSDLPEDFQIMVYVFADLDLLSKALRESDTLPDEKKLIEFNRGLAQAHPLVSFLDCGSGNGAVEAKIKHHYELYVENCHCRHTILGLDHDSEYFAVLNSYSEDELTLSKTSLIKSIHGIPSKYNLPFTVADFSSLDTVPLISLDGGSELVVEAHQIEGGSASDLRILHNDESDKDASPSSSDAKDASSQSSLSQKTGGDGVSDLLKSTTSSSPSLAKVVLSSSSKVRKAPSASDSHDGSTGIQRVIKSSKGPDGRRFGSLGQAVNAGTVPSQWQAQPQTPEHTTRPLPMDSYHDAVSSYMHDWENAPAQNMYTPPVDLTPWGATAETSWADAAKEDKAIDDDHAFPKGDNREAESRKSTTEWQSADGSAAKPTNRYWENREAHQRKGGIGHRVSGPPSGRKTVWTMQPVDSHAVVNEPLSKYARSKHTNGSPGVPITFGYAINQVGERMDLPLPTPSSSDQSRYDRRTKSQRLCNDHHLSGTCRVDNCKHDHEPADDGILLVLRQNARRAPCNQGSSCRNLSCFRGHMCPYKESKSGCQNSKCVFYAAGLHNVAKSEVVEMITS